MFFIIDIIPVSQILKALQTSCKSCNKIGELRLMKSYQCLRLFFIPVFKWQIKYYLEHSCGTKLVISEEDALAILHAGVSPEEVAIQEKIIGPRRCNSCGRVLEENFICCPYCGNQTLNG